MLSRRLRRALVAAGATVALVALITAWQAWRVRSALDEARAGLSAVVEQLDAGDQEAARKSAAQAEDGASSASFHTHTPVWWVAQYLPVLGDDVSAVRDVSSAAHELTRRS